MSDTKEHLLEGDTFPYERFGILTAELPEEICDQLVADHKKKQWDTSRVESHKIIDKNIRDSKNQWMNYGEENSWMFDILWEHLRRFNAVCSWGFDIRLCENLQITQYLVGDYYDFHSDSQCDYTNGAINKDNMTLHGCVRKISAVILLNDDFEGGEFQFTSYAKGEGKIIDLGIKKKGTIVFFPSFMEHRVAPVTKGERYSLVAWFGGPPLR